jgi:hypothetical protein
MQVNIFTFIALNDFNSSVGSMTKHLTTEHINDKTSKRTERLMTKGITGNTSKETKHILTKGIMRQNVYRQKV